MAEITGFDCDREGCKEHLEGNDPQADGWTMVRIVTVKDGILEKNCCETHTKEIQELLTNKKEE